MKFLSLVGVLWMLAGPAGAVQNKPIRTPAPVRAQPQAAPQAPQQQQFINLSLINALVAIHEEGLAGLFAYIAEPNAAPAFAEYLFRTPKALKLFAKKDEQDLKVSGAINEWDKEVFLYIITLNSNSSLTGVNTLSPKMMDKVSTLSLAPGVPLSEMTMRRRR